MQKREENYFMFKLRFLPLYILVLLMLILVFFQSWTFYLGTTDVTFKRLLGATPYAQIEDISLRRYKKGVISPHLFTITTTDEKVVIEKLSNACDLQKITAQEIPKAAHDTDEEMIEVIQKSPIIYLSKQYDLQNPKEGRMCLLFKDKDYLYLFINGNL